MNKESEMIDLLFVNARTHSVWTDKVIEDDTLVELYNIVKLAPTSANCSPARFLFIKSAEAKRRLKPAISEGNIDQTMSAPVTVIIGYDLEFYEHLDFLFPKSDAKSWFTESKELILETAFRNSCLQGAYLILAARSLGLDCGPMSGFNKDLINKEFFKDDKCEVNFLCNLGYGKATSIKEKLPRLNFDVACKVL